MRRLGKSNDAPNRFTLFYYIAPNNGKIPQLRNNGYTAFAFKVLRGFEKYIGILSLQTNKMH